MIQIEQALVIRLSIYLTFLFNHQQQSELYVIHTFLFLDTLSRHTEFKLILNQQAAVSKKAKDGKIQIEDMAGGTFTISNGGVFGSLMGTPILNTPQCKHHQTNHSSNHTTLIISI